MKKYIITGLLMALESSGARAQQLASHMFAYGRPIPLDEIVSHEYAVSGTWSDPVVTKVTPPQAAARNPD